MKSERTLNMPRKSWYLKTVDTDGRPRYDVSPLWANPAAFTALVTDIKTHFEQLGIQYDVIVAMDALGFILGGALANATGKGLVPLRKGGKLPLLKEKIVAVAFEDWDFDVDGVEKRFEVVRGLIKSGDRVLLVDEWMGTGAQMRAAIQIMEEVGGVVEAIAVLYVFPDEERNWEMMRQYETFAANCLVCRHFECRCEDEDGDGNVEGVKEGKGGQFTP